MTRTRHPPGLSDSSLMTLWRRAVLAHYGNRCIICGDGGILECHHCVKRRYKLLRYDFRNGVPVHFGESDRKGVYAAPPEHQDFLLAMARATFKQYLSEVGITESEWRGRVKASLLAELARCEVAHG